MSFGTATIIFKHLVKTGAPDELGEYTLKPVPTPAPGCRHRPLTFAEAVELNFDIAKQPWKSTVPLHEYSANLIAAIKAIRNNDIIEVNGQEYQIVGGVQPFDDLEGNPFKATIISQIHVS